MFSWDSEQKENGHLDKAEFARLQHVGSPDGQRVAQRGHADRHAQHQRHRQARAPLQGCQSR